MSIREHQAPGTEGSTEGNTGKNAVSSAALKTARRWLLGLTLCLTAAATAAAAPSEGQDTDERGNQDRQVRLIEVDTRAECDGDDCPEARALSFALGAGSDVEEKLQGLFGSGHAKIFHLGGHGMEIGMASGAFLGVGLSELTPELRAHFGVPEDAGVMVSKVVEDSPAARGGVLVGDVIYRVDGEPVANSRDLGRRIRGLDADDIVDLDIWREGSAVAVTTTLDEREGHHFGGEARRVIVRCDGEDGDEDCNVDVQTGPLEDFDFDCDGADECRVQVACHGGSCDCAVNGESVDCSTIPGAPQSE